MAVKEKKAKYKVVLSDQVKQKMKTLKPKDKKILNDAIVRLANDPFIGKPANYAEIEVWPNEVCQVCKGGTFEEPVRMYWEKNSDEIDCSCPVCNDGFWMKKSELITGRKKYLANMSKNIFKVKKGSPNLKRSKNKLELK